MKRSPTYRKGLPGLALLVLAFLPAAALFSGCENDSTGVYFKDGSHPQGNHQRPTAPVGKGTLPGSWQLTAADGSSWYVHFNQDGTWQITDDAAGQAYRVSGGYSTTGNSFSGNMVNPGVGSGEINGSWDGDSITLNFIEHWHTPYKVIPYTGTRL